MSKFPDSIDKITKARLRFSAFGSIVSIALAMFFIGILVYFAFFSHQLMQNISQKFEMEILFYGTVKEADIASFEQQLKLEPFIATSKLSSRADNVKTAIEAVGQNFMEILESNPINASILFTVKPQYANIDSLATISKSIMQSMIVRDVVYADVIVNTVLNNLITIEIVIFGISFIFIFIAILLIANVIRLNIYAKRLNIRSMLLVGATRNFVRKPFITKGFIQGVWGGILAIVALAATLYLGNQYIPQFIDFKYISILSLILLAIFIFSILFTIIIALLSVNKYIKINRDRLYL
ncbi:MAG TPA: permease-like cell division protein FtsX [Bacteroidales bacterium]|nr:permease-like cell division protein FtsX [Bacteroidales bacterium]